MSWNLFISWDLLLLIAVFGWLVLLHVGEGEEL